MSLHADRVGVRDLHDRLSEHLERVEAGREIVVTRRGKPVARLAPIDTEDPLAGLVARGLVTPARPGPRRSPAPIEATGSVSDLVAEQRR